MQAHATDTATDACFLCIGSDRHVKSCDPSRLVRDESGQSTSRSIDRSILSRVSAVLAPPSALLSASKRTGYMQRPVAPATPSDCIAQRDTIEADLRSLDNCTCTCTCTPSPMQVVRIMSETFAQFIASLQGNIVDNGQPTTDSKLVLWSLRPSHTHARAADCRPRLVAIQGGCLLRYSVVWRVP